VLQLRQRIGTSRHYSSTTPLSQKHRAHPPPRKYLPVAYSYSTFHDSSTCAVLLPILPAYRSLRRAAPVRAWLCTRSGSGTHQRHRGCANHRSAAGCRLQCAGYVSVSAPAVRVRSPECNVRGSRASGRMDGREGGAGRWIWYGRARWGNSGGCVF
jgi:hypothetical protein